MIERITKGSALGLDYKINSTSGIVCDSTNRSEAHVSGIFNGGGDGAIHSHTANFQNLFLLDEEGRENILEIKDLLVPCRQGHNITALQLSTNGRKEKPYFMAYNHSTREIHSSKEALQESMRGGGIIAITLFLPIFFIAISPLAGLGGASFFSFLALCALWVLDVDSFLSKIRVQTVITDLALKNYIENLKDKKPLQKVPILINEDSKKCPICAEMIKYEAIKCRFCNHAFDSIEANAVCSDIKERVSHADPAFCPECKKCDSYVDASGEFYCPNCNDYV
jgi:hypothetical protein